MLQDLHVPTVTSSIWLIMTSDLDTRKLLWYSLYQLQFWPWDLASLLKPHPDIMECPVSWNNGGVPQLQCLIAHPALDLQRHQMCCGMAQALNSASSKQWFWQILDWGTILRGLDGTCHVFHCQNEAFAGDTVAKELYNMRAFAAILEIREFKGRSLGGSCYSSL